MKMNSCTRAYVHTYHGTCFHSVLASAEVRVTYVYGQTIMSILYSYDSSAHVSNSRAKALRGSCERSLFNVNLLASCTVGKNDSNEADTQTDIYDNQQCFNLLTSVQYSHSAWFLDTY